ncbi:beta-ketoacyl synthase chain length factor, partial [Methylibium sp.]|uniref:beta-ketoacyl synthase chain length factor n=1 Tax=Methylibium sp. TaxID=2067992 RepID=UPI0018325CAD
LTLAVAEQACAQAGVDPHELATVFTSSSGDAANCHALCEALAAAERIVSPTRFTNSVHNAAAGYWHIATASRAPSTSLCGHDASFAAGLLEAAVQCVAWQRPVLLVAGDVPYPEPLQRVRPLPDAFALALLLAPPSGAPASAQLSLRFGSDPQGHAQGDERFDALRLGVPAARGLPLLQALARRESATLRLDDLAHCPFSIDLVFRETTP